MKHLELEKELTARIRKRRMIEGGLTLIFIVIGIIFSVLYEQSKVVEEITGEGILAGLLTYQSVTYNEHFYWCMSIGVAGALFSGLLFFLDIWFSKFVTVQANRDYITLYRGMAHTKLYVNGDSENSNHFGYYLEAVLSDGTKVTATLGKFSAHLTFSNGHPPIDI